MWNILLVLVVVIALICLWVLIYDTNRFVIRNYTLQDKRIAKNCKAVVLADLHNKKYGRKNEILVQAIKEQNPDFIMIAGDLLTAKPGAKLDVAVDLLKELIEICPVYYGVGNHEHRMKLYPDVYGDMAERYQKELEALHLQLLVNEAVVLEEFGISICGSQIEREYYKRFRVTPMDEAYLDKLLGKRNDSCYQILLAHNPDYFEQYCSWGADLTLAGHLHGGMVRVPFWWKGVVSPSFKLFPKYDGGLFTRENSSMIVSRGLGMHTIPIRIFNPGELLVLHFENTTLS